MELLSPVGSFECLKAAVQNGADAVYFGAGQFNARAFASNFEEENLTKAIHYAKLRNVKTHLTLNTLLKKEELQDAIILAQTAYQAGIDAVIVQDLGLAYLLKKYLPLLPLHASTQMTIHNLEGVRQLEQLGFQRVVLARELSINEIQFICDNSSLEIEVFIHGALCISYSGQCLFSSMVGGRSGNRGTCAQPCRLAYQLIEKKEKNTNTLQKGYLLSPRDLCGLESIPALLQAGVASLKIEGRMKSPEYVATVTRIYRKYIDLAKSDRKYEIDPQDKTDLLQVFNRGGFSSGHLSSSANVNLVYPEKPNNIGLPLGNISKLNHSKGLVTFESGKTLAIGDQVTFEKEQKRYTVSEISIGNHTIKQSKSGQTITIGRMKGNLNLGDKVYKVSSKKLSELAKNSFETSQEPKKIPFIARIKIEQNKPITLEVKAVPFANNLYNPLHITVTSTSLPEEAKNQPLTEEKVKMQLSKTKDTPYFFEKITVKLQPNTFLPNIRILNELRRDAIQKLEEAATSLIERPLSVPTIGSFSMGALSPSTNQKPTISLLLNYLYPEWDYRSLQKVDAIYLPLRYFILSKYNKVLEQISKHFSVYLYLPTIIKPNYKNLLSTSMENAIQNYPISGAVLSNLSHLSLIRQIERMNPKQKLEYIANYTLNCWNPYCFEVLKQSGIDKFTFSPELNKQDILSYLSSGITNAQLIVYGNTPLMTLNYCLLGKSNKCYPQCPMHCKEQKQYYLKDRKNYLFRFVPDNVQTITTIYNSKITSICTSGLPVSSYRIDCLDETIPEINHIIETVKKKERLEGENYTNGNFYKEI